MAGLLLLIITALKWVVIVDVVLSWVMPNENQFPRSFTRQVTTPLYAPLQKILNPQAMGGLDLSPLVIIILLELMASALSRVG